MRISELNKREPFNFLLLQTLIEVFKSEDSSAKIFFVKRFSYSYFRYFNYIWFCNPYLNFYAKLETPSRLFDALNKEYRQSTKKYLNIVQWLFVNISISKIGRVLLSSSHIAILSNSKSFKETILLGGNHRIRLLRPTRKSTQLILKIGFSDFWINNELIHRRKIISKNIPKILSYDFPYLSFEEEYRPGIPINRLSSKQHELFRVKAYKILYDEISSKNIYKLRVKDYVIQVISSISNILRNRNFKNDWQEESEMLKELLSKIEQINTHSDCKISISLSHGDFQDANILVDDDKNIVIIDWESVEYRWIGYDFLTLVLGSRINLDIDYPLFTYKTNIWLNQLNSLNIFELDMRSAYILFWLEELRFQILNQCEPVFYSPGIYLKELFCKVKGFTEQI